jgi:hypothetical protein
VNCGLWLFCSSGWSRLIIPAGSRDSGIRKVLIPNPGIEKMGPRLESLYSWHHRQASVRVQDLRLWYDTVAHVYEIMYGGTAFDSTTEGPPKKIANYRAAKSTNVACNIHHDCNFIIYCHNNLMLAFKILILQHYDQLHINILVWSRVIKLDGIFASCTRWI